MIVDRVAKLAVDVYHAAQKPRELTALGELIIDRGYQTAVEIGTSYGGTAWFLWALGLTVTSIDDCDEEFLRCAPSTHGYPPLRIPEINYIVGDSSQLIGLDPVDVIFIDGNHTYAGAKADWEHWRRNVNPDGIIAFHDVAANVPENCVEVKHLFVEIAMEYETTKFIDPVDDGYPWGGFDAVGNRHPWGGIGVVYL